MSATDVPGIVSVSGSTSATDQGDYWEVDINSNAAIMRVGNQATVENVLFNCEGSIAQLNTYNSGHGWTIRNVGWNGTFPDLEHSGNVALALSGSGTVDNVYLGDGGYGDWQDKHGGSRHYQPTAVFTTNDTPNGEITIRNAMINNWTDNACYCSGQNTSATFTFENCYAEGNDISVFRVADGTHRVTNCHTRNNTHRDVWVYTSGSQMIIGGGSQLQNNRAVEGPGSADVRDATVGSSANPQIPSSVPQSAREAATGQAGGGGGSDVFNQPVCMQDIV